MKITGLGALLGAALLSVFAARAMSANADANSTGEQVYVQQCVGCHGAQLSGSTGPAIGPALKGRAFLDRWGNASVDDLAAYVQKSMPLNMPGSLSQAEAAAVSRYVLAVNGKTEAADTHGDTAKTTGRSVERGEAFLTNAYATNTEDMDGPYRAAIAARGALIGNLRAVDDRMLAKPADQDWLSWRGSSATQGFSPLAQINRANVGKLGLAWSLSLPAGTNGIAPLIHGGVMFINSNGAVEALDARSGDPIWSFSRPAAAPRTPSNQPRGIALYGDALYVPTVDAHVLALDAKTGKLRWDHAIATANDSIQLTAAPIVIRGKVIQGVSGCQGSARAGGCFIVALDARTGNEVWRFNTIARPGTPGGDSWNGAPLEGRFGGSVWNTGSYDADLNLYFVGVGQTYTISTLLDPQKRKGGSKDALFTNTTLALDPDTGKLVWYYQHQPSDVWDFDWAFERTLVTVNGRRIVVTGGKIGIFDALDAATGQYLWSQDLGLQNIVIHIDPKTGRKTNDPRLAPEVGKPKLICPSVMGNRNWMTTAYAPESQFLYVPLHPTCMDYARAAPNDPGAMGEMVFTRRPRPDSDGHHGWLAAIDLANRKIAWVQKRRAPQISAIMTTAGGLVFEGGRDRAFRANDESTGKTLWQTWLPAAPNAYPFSYMVDGVQYVGIVAGGSSPIDLFEVPLTPEYPASNGIKTIMVFALPQVAP